ncbi:MAG: cell wall-binding repeat-containing protein [Clostridioides sp.]|jgi:putative cell wall-binding protein|nr:cell wall-binding repeat-containing protein [Clostridioides sp.]
MKFRKKALALALSASFMIVGIQNVNALDNVDKIAGADRYETAGKIADTQDYKTAILVNTDKSLSDGLSASGLSGALNAPILLTRANEIPKSTTARLKGVETVYVIGGKTSVSDKVEKSIKANKIKFVRIEGKDRTKTSIKVADKVKTIKGSGSKVFFVNGVAGEADAMSVSSVAAREKSPIILTDGKTTTYSTSGKEAYIIGGTTSMSNTVAKKAIRLSGKDRFETNKKIIGKFYANSKEFYLSKAYVLVDALTGSSIAKQKPIVLVDDRSDKSVIKNAVKLTALGGIDEDVIAQCLNITNGVGDELTGFDDKTLDIAQQAGKDYHDSYLVLHDLSVKAQAVDGGVLTEYSNEKPYVEMSKTWKLPQVGQMESNNFTLSSANRTYKYNGNKYNMYDYRDNNFDYDKDSKEYICVNQKDNNDILRLETYNNNGKWTTDDIWKLETKNSSQEKYASELRANGVDFDRIDVKTSLVHGMSQIAGERHEIAWYVSAYKVVDGKDTRVGSKAYNQKELLECNAVNHYHSGYRATDNCMLDAMWK